MRGKNNIPLNVSNISWRLAVYVYNKPNEIFSEYNKKIIYLCGAYSRWIGLEKFMTTSCLVDDKSSKMIYSTFLAAGMVFVVLVREAFTCLASHARRKIEIFFMAQTLHQHFAPSLGFLWSRRCRLGYASKAAIKGPGECCSKLAQYPGKHSQWCCVACDVVLKRRPRRRAKTWRKRVWWTRMSKPNIEAFVHANVQNYTHTNLHIYTT